jgi:hypothetical protein
MCWFSVEYEKHVEEAKPGQRLGIRTMVRSTNWHVNWVVCESELRSPKPCPVCVIDDTKVLFRFSENHQESLQVEAEVEAAFKMLKHPKRDVFEFADGRQITLGDLPNGLVFDVLLVPGTERLSDLLGMQVGVRQQKKKEQKSERESFLDRLLACL